MSTEGFFNIRRLDNKIALKLKGDFNVDNIYWVSQMLINRKFFHSTFLELDMSEAKDISVQAMDLLIAALEKLKARGIVLKVADSSRNKLTMTNDLIAQ